MKKLFFIFFTVLLLTDCVYSQCLTIDTGWARLYNGSGNGADHLYDMKIHEASGNVFVTGKSLGGGGLNQDYITIKYNTTGTELWNKRFDGVANGTDAAFAIDIDELQNVYVTGESRGAAANGDDYITIKYDMNGDSLWVRRYDGTAHNNDNAYSIFVDDSMNVYVTGQGAETGGGHHYVTIKYDANGNELWIRKFKRTLSANTATKVIVDAFYNVWVTGYSSGAGGAGHDYVTLKYTSGGVLTDTCIYNGSGNNDDEPLAITSDNSGNVYITGKSLPLSGLTDYITIKYNSNGDSLWTRRYDGGDDNKDEANAICVDNSGNVYVTGESRNSSNGADYLTLKYDPNGNIVWEKRYDGSAHGTDIARSIALGNNGFVYAGGGSSNSGTIDDFVIVEYDEITGNECYVNRRTSVGNDNIYEMQMDYSRGLIFACGETAAGGGSYDCMSARYCLTGLVTLNFNVKAIIEGFYDQNSNSMSLSDTVRGILRSYLSPFPIIDSV